MTSLSHAGNKVQIRDFAREILTDLPELMKDHPMGVKISDMLEYYGESEQRIARAVLLLLTDGRITREQRAGGAYYITPLHYKMPRPHPELTHNQWKVLEYLWTLPRDDKNEIITNHSRVANSLGLSVGGTTAAFGMLQKLEYVSQTQPYHRDTREIKYTLNIMPEWDRQNGNVLPLEEGDSA